jgi:class 3 adenylate cyclase
MLTDITKFYDAGGRSHNKPDWAAAERIPRRHDRGRVRPRGTVVKIVGDALNVLFGAPTDQPDHAARAVACAMALDAFAEDFRVRWCAQGVAVQATRIGINAGSARVGSFGGGRFFDYTAYGDTINIAARLEGRTSTSEPASVSAVPWLNGYPIFSAAPLAT